MLGPHPMSEQRQFVQSDPRIMNVTLKQVRPGKLVAAQNDIPFPRRVVHARNKQPSLNLSKGLHLAPHAAQRSPEG